MKLSILNKFADLIAEVSKFVYFLMSKSDLKPLWKECDPLELVYKYLKQAKKYDLPGTDSEKFSPTNIIRLRFENLVKMIMIKQNDRAFKLTFLNEKKLSEYQIKDLSFCFEDNTTSRKLIGGLLDMGYQKEEENDIKITNTYINSVEDYEISQILFHQNDCYINGLRSVYNCFVNELMSPEIMKSLINDNSNSIDFLKNISNNDSINKQNNSNNANTNINTKSISTNSNSIEGNLSILSEIFGKFELTINDYYSDKISTHKFVDIIGLKIKTIIIPMAEILNLRIDIEKGDIKTNKDTYNEEKNFMVQFKFMDFGYLEKLMRLFDIVSKFKLKVRNLFIKSYLIKFIIILGY